MNLTTLQQIRAADERDPTPDLPAARAELTARLLGLTVPELCGLYQAVYGWPPRKKVKAWVVGKLVYWGLERSHAREAIAF